MWVEMKLYAALSLNWYQQILFRLCSFIYFCILVYITKEQKLHDKRAYVSAVLIKPLLLFHSFLLITLQWIICTPTSTQCWIMVHLTFQSLTVLNAKSHNSTILNSKNNSGIFIFVVHYHSGYMIEQWRLLLRCLCCVWL